MGYEVGKVPAAALFGAVPFGMESPEFMAWMYFGGGNELLREVFKPHNVYPIFCGTIGPEGAGWFRKEINTPDDIKGLKFRAAGYGGDIYKEVGASVTLLPGGELFQALEKGVLDGTEFSLPTVDEQLGFYKVAKYYYMPGWHQPSTNQYLYVNLAAWNKTQPADPGDHRNHLHRRRDHRACEVGSAAGQDACQVREGRRAGQAGQRPLLEGLPDGNQESHGGKVRGQSAVQEGL